MTRSARMLRYAARSHTATARARTPPHEDHHRHFVIPRLRRQILRHLAQFRAAAGQSMEPVIVCSIVIEPRADTFDPPHKRVGLDAVTRTARRRRLERHAARAVDLHPLLNAPREVQERREVVPRHGSSAELPPRPAARQRLRQPFHRHGRRQVDARLRFHALHHRRRRIGNELLPVFHVRHFRWGERHVFRRRMEERRVRIPSAPPRIGARYFRLGRSLRSRNVASTSTSTNGCSENPGGTPATSASASRSRHSPQRASSSMAIGATSARTPLA